MSKILREYLYSNDNNDYQKCFSNNLAYYRQKNKGKKGKPLTQKELADMLNVTERTIMNWEQGRNCPEISTLIEICKTLHCDMDHLLGRIPERTYDNHFICEATGLSEAAVETLIKRTKYIKSVENGERHSLEDKLLNNVWSYRTSALSLNYLIEDNYYENALSIIGDYIIRNDNLDIAHTSWLDENGEPQTEDFEIRDNNVWIDNIPIDNEYIKLGLMRKIQNRLDWYRKDNKTAILERKKATD